MTVTTCDLCGATIPSGKVVVSFMDGEHPHDGRQMWKPADVCPRCLGKLGGLVCGESFEVMKKQVLKGD